MRRGQFIVLEGIDGSGTTTQAELLTRTLWAHGRAVLSTREPTSGPVGVLLRQALTHAVRDENGLVAFDWKTMALLFAADRTDHVERSIEPALARGEVVVCDRYDLSSLIYQSATSPEGAAARPWLQALNGQAIRPDVVVVLDVPEEQARQRREARAGAEELFEKSQLQKRLARDYASARQLAPEDRIVVVSGTGSVEEVAERIRASLSEFPEFAFLGAPPA